MILNALESFLVLVTLGSVASGQPWGHHWRNDGQGGELRNGVLEELLELLHKLLELLHKLLELLDLIEL